MNRNNGNELLSRTRTSTTAIDGCAAVAHASVPVLVYITDFYFLDYVANVVSLSLQILPICASIASEVKSISQREFLNRLSPIGARTANVICSHPIPGLSLPLKVKNLWPCFYARLKYVDSLCCLLLFCC